MPTCDAVLTAVDEYLRTRDVSETRRQEHLVGGGAVGELERKLSSHYGMRHALAVSNASTGLLALALALDLRGDEFVTTPYTYGASIGAWVLLGNRPVFADIDGETLTLDPLSVRRRLTERTRAILAVDIYGYPCDQAALRRLADERDLWYIADAAQSLGAARQGQPSGSLADALVVSFTVGKPLDVGEGGAIVTDRTELYERLIWLTQHPHRQKLELGLDVDNEIGVNARIHPLAAVWGVATFEAALQRTRDRQRRCFEAIDVINASGLAEPIHFSKRGIAPTFFRVTAAWKDGNVGGERDLVETLRRAGIKASVGRAPVRLLYRQPAYQALCGDARAHPCAEAERQAERRFCLERGIPP